MLAVEASKRIRCSKICRSRPEPTVITRSTQSVHSSIGTSIEQANREAPSGNGYETRAGDRKSMLRRASCVAFSFKTIGVGTQARPPTGSMSSGSMEARDTTRCPGADTHSESSEPEFRRHSVCPVSSIPNETGSTLISIGL